MREVDLAMIGGSLGAPFNVLTDSQAEHTTLELFLELTGRVGPQDLDWSPLSVKRVGVDPGDMKFPESGITIAMLRANLPSADELPGVESTLDIRINNSGSCFELTRQSKVSQERSQNSHGGTEKVTVTELSEETLEFTRDHLRLSYAMARRVGRFMNSFTGWTKDSNGVWVPPK